MYLDLLEESEGSKIAEWFYVVVCSPEYLKKPLNKTLVLDKKYLIVQKEYKPKEVLEETKKKVSKIKAMDWSDFYKQMQNEFLYEA